MFWTNVQQQVFCGRCQRVSHCWLLTFKSEVQQPLQLHVQLLTRKRKTDWGQHFCKLPAGSSFSTALMLWPFSALHYGSSPLSRHCCSRWRWNNLCNHSGGMVTLVCLFFVNFPHSCNPLPKRWLKKPQPHNNKSPAFSWRGRGGWGINTMETCRQIYS